MEINVMNIEHVIKARLGLQTTKRILDELGVNVLPLKSGGLYFKCNNKLTSEMKKRLIITLGGRVNYKETERLLANL